MMPRKPTQLAACAAAILAGACATGSGAAPPVRDQDSAMGEPSFEPMLVVPMPDLGAPVAGQRAVEALQARNTPIGDVLLTLFRDSDINLLVDAAVQARECTFDIKRSTVEETFAAVLRSLDLGYEWDGNYLRIVERVRETVHVDLMDAASSNTGSGDSGSSGSSGDSGSGAETDSFWAVLENSLPNLLGEDGTIVVNRAASTIHVDARPSAIARLREIVSTTVGRANRQVSIEARLLEVRLDDAHSLGVNWALLPGGANTSQAGLAGGGAIVRQVAASGGTALTFGVLDSNDFSVFVDALERQGQVRVLSSPRVSTMNNQVASIAITDQVPYITREVIDDQGVARTEYGVEFVEAGVTLNVRPMIGEDGLLTVAVTPQVREQTGTVVTPDGLITVPVISERQATTLVRVANGQAIALGGLRSTRKDETRQGVPFLMNIPYLGQLFSSTVQGRQEVELMIVLVPRVLDDAWIAEGVRRGAHRLADLRRGFQWSPLGIENLRGEDWSGGELQGAAESAPAPSARTAERPPALLPADAGLTVTRRGLAAHWLHLAQGELDAGNVAAAVTAIERALALEPSNLTGLVAAGVLQQRVGHVPAARTHLDRALALRGDDAIALTARGVLELADGAPNSARRYFARAHELAKSPTTALNLAAALLSLDRTAEARDLLAPLAGDGVPPELHANLAYAQWATGQTDAANVSLQQALELGVDPRNPRVVALQRLLTAPPAAPAPAER